MREDTETKGKRPRDDGERDQSDAADSQGPPKGSDNHQRLEEAKKDFFESSENRVFREYMTLSTF